MWMRCARPGTVGASQLLPSATRFRTRPGDTPSASQDEREARRAAEEAKRAAEQAAAAAQAAAEAASQGAGDMPPAEETKSTWGETMATVVGAAAPTILAGVVLYYLTRTPQ